MQKALKAALLSGLVFPGLGYLALQRRARGLIVLTTATACVAYLVVIAMQQASAVVDRLMAGDVPMDASSIEHMVATTSTASGTLLSNLVSFGLLACWLFSIVDGYRIGRQQDAVTSRARRAPPPLARTQTSASVARKSGVDAASVSVRAARADELPQLLSLFAHLHTNDIALPAPEIVEATWRQILAQPGMRILVAEASGQLVATVTLSIIPNLTRGARPYALIENVVTDRAWRGQGVGTRLLQSAQEMAWQAGCYKAMLMTGSKKQATLDFYRRAGFVDGDKTGFVARPARLLPVPASA